MTKKKKYEKWELGLDKKFGEEGRIFFFFFLREKEFFHVFFF